jgi:hypothetical protein
MEAICDWTNLSALDEATELLLRELKGSPTDLMKLVVRIAPDVSDDCRGRVHLQNDRSNDRSRRSQVRVSLLGWVFFVQPLDAAGATLRPWSRSTPR